MEKIVIHNKVKKINFNNILKMLIQMDFKNNIT